MVRLMCAQSEPTSRRLVTLAWNVGRWLTRAAAATAWHTSETSETGGCPVVQEAKEELGRGTPRDGLD